VSIDNNLANYYASPSKIKMTGGVYTYPSFRTHAYYLHIRI